MALQSQLQASPSQLLILQIIISAHKSNALINLQFWYLLVDTLNSIFCCTLHRIVLVWTGAPACGCFSFHFLQHSPGPVSPPISPSTHFLEPRAMPQQNIEQVNSVIIAPGVLASGSHCKHAFINLIMPSNVSSCPLTWVLLAWQLGHVISCYTSSRGPAWMLGMFLSWWRLSYRCSSCHADKSPST